MSRRTGGGGTVQSGSKPPNGAGFRARKGLQSSYEQIRTTGNAIAPSRRTSSNGVTFSFLKSPTKVCPWSALSFLLEGSPMAAVLHAAKSMMAKRNRSFIFLRFSKWFMPPDQKGRRTPSKYRDLRYFMSGGCLRSPKTSMDGPCGSCRGRAAFC